ncbi:aspartate kinase [Algoriphagus machipongonensis]|uniref:Aspartokinase n=1 Tax=Algoriphagus machipongonensis TaxID=388413 RepID=A3I264_9BACT|nr:aspartate kinase [Algoriphagus machipongonensis]EAZ79468.1 lysine-sensitive aspartokinase 3 [Algoriphagus machipongonensis]
MSKTIVYKFGGASVKDADAMKNLLDILRNRLRKNMVIVVSAMGKTTNSLEEILRLKMEGEDFSSNYTILKEFHLSICHQLFPDSHRVFAVLDNLFTSMSKQLNAELSEDNYDEYYDSIIGFGELFSSTIVMEYLCENDLLVLWQDARELIKTNSDFRFAKIDWAKTRKNCQTKLKAKIENFPVVTQGFIGSDSQSRPTTLGREGSDFTAAILASCLKASSVTIWKDVPGVLNADPKKFSSYFLFEELDYKQAAEMTYYGASVIHPKTIMPLANARIPLFVKSFISPEDPGTKIHSTSSNSSISTYVLKEKQLLISFRVTDFTFIEEEQIHRVYEELKSLKLRVNMLQISAISISIVLDEQPFKLDRLLNRLKNDFEIRYNSNLELLTILHPEKSGMDSVMKDYEVFLEQQTRNTFQVVRRKNMLS